MLHHYLRNDTSGDHWGVSLSSSVPCVLVQLQQDGEQVRVQMTPEQADAMAEELRRFAQRTRLVGTERF